MVRRATFVPLLDMVAGAIHPSANVDSGEDIPGSTSEVLQASHSP
jgi:hypothetical protein